MSVASLLHVFNITPGVDASGNAVSLSTESTGELVASVSRTFLLEFRC